MRPYKMMSFTEKFAWFRIFIGIIGSVLGLIFSSPLGFIALLLSLNGLSVLTGISSCCKVEYDDMKLKAKKI